MIPPAEMAERMRVVTEAESWVRTPWRHHSNVRGAGVDCAYHIVESHVGAGLANRFEVERYNRDWHCHRNEERYLAKVEEYLKRVDDTEVPLFERPEDFFVYPGNVIVFRHGRTFSHGAIVKAWPVIVHASAPAGMVVYENIVGTTMERKPMRVYSFWGR